ncbi:hypothetical protein [Edwardsiella tarda]|uniref:hypothetical protein n=1 Tax=Edwardsiella tarda TaxID=636 RepID=UPI0012674CD7|nr:hypothetical protein [Edwardsiella tarda]
MKNKTYITVMISILFVGLVCILFLYLEFNAGEVLKIVVPTITSLLTVVSGLFIFQLQRNEQNRKAEENKNEEKERLAAIIYSEINNAQLAIDTIKTESIKNQEKNITGAIINEGSPVVLVSESWNKNKHLFIRDLKKEHFEVIDGSFNAAIQAEDCRKWAVELFRGQALQKASSRINIISLISKDLVMEKLAVKYKISQANLITDQQIVDAKKEAETSISMLIDGPSNLFIPTELNHRAELALQQFKPIINTPAGEALKLLCGSLSL